MGATPSMGASEQGGAEQRTNCATQDETVSLRVTEVAASSAFSQPRVALCN